MHPWWCLYRVGVNYKHIFCTGKSPPDQEYRPGDVTLPGLLRFTTGTSTIPPMGLHAPIELIYQPALKTAELPKSQACFCTLMLPVIHKTQESFFDSFEKALKFGGGYGNA